jgi:iron complex outermembrane receptor protein
LNYRWEGKSFINVTASAQLRSNSRAKELQEIYLTDTMLLKKARIAGININSLYANTLKHLVYNGLLNTINTYAQQVSYFDASNNTDKLPHRREIYPE